jgi:hypothetical protein
MKLREIAARIAQEASKYPPKLDYMRKRGTEGPDTFVSFEFGTLRIKCRAFHEAVQAVAEKYRKGTASLRSRQNLPPATLPKGRHSLKRPPDADKLLAALEAELAEPMPETAAVA